MINDIEYKIGKEPQDFFEWDEESDLRKEEYKHELAVLTSARSKDRQVAAESWEFTNKMKSVAIAQKQKQIRKMEVEIGFRRSEIEKLEEEKKAALEKLGGKDLVEKGEREKARLAAIKAWVYGSGEKPQPEKEEHE